MQNEYSARFLSQFDDRAYYYVERLKDRRLFEVYVSSSQHASWDVDCKSGIEQWCSMYPHKLSDGRLIDLNEVSIR
jgi:hypothetical protein